MREITVDLNGSAVWWYKYILPEGGIMLDPFAGSGTMRQ